MGWVYLILIIIGVVVLIAAGSLLGYVLEGIGFIFDLILKIIFGGLSLLFNKITLGIVILMAAVYILMGL